uniref:Uncharacterized protein n=1 Tax=Megaselia scalaris TaxID=36166 RepID=T1GWJ4_MEGSC
MLTSILCKVQIKQNQQLNQNKHQHQSYQISVPNEFVKWRPHRGGIVYYSVYAEAVATIMTRKS